MSIPVQNLPHGAAGRLGETVLNVFERFDPGIERWEVLPRPGSLRCLQTWRIWRAASPGYLDTNGYLNIFEDNEKILF